MNNNDSSPNVIDLQLFISGQTATTGTVDIPLQGWSQTFTVTPGAVTTVTVPSASAHHVLNDVVDTRGVHITTADTVSVFAINFRSYTADASKVLPIRSLGTEYIVTSFAGVNSTNSSEFLIVATEDGTEIDITPSVPTAGGHPAGVTYTIQLDQGESYQVVAVGTADLSGSTVSGTLASGPCRPFAVFAGSQCANIPVGCTYCDHIYDQLLPTPSWGTEYYIAPFVGTSGFTYQVMARDNGTSVTIDGGAPFVLNAGQHQFFNNVPLGTQVSATSPISVTQFMQGLTCSSTGDPAMVVLNADDQKISNVTFSTITSTIINQHNLNVIVETADIGTVLLDNVPIPATSFVAFPSNPLNSYASVPITQGSHNIQAPNGFSAYAYGTGLAESYAYSVGSFKTEPPLIIDSALCSNDTVILSPPVSFFSPVWTTMSDTSTVIGTTNNLILVPPIVNDVYVVTGNSLISGCEFEYSYSVSVPDSIGIVASASDDTVCMFQSVQMNASVSLPGLFEYQWSPSHSFDDPTSQNPVLTASTSGWYYVTVSSFGSTCNSATDSVYVHVDGGTIGTIDLQTSNTPICSNDSSQHSVDVYQIQHFDDFNGGNDPNLWSSLGGFSNSNICGSISGDVLFFGGASPRTAETVDMNTTAGGTVKFNIKIASGLAPCEDADPGEDVLFQYSNNGGTTWTTITTLLESAYPNFTFVSVPIPAAAQTAATRFRWTQPIFTGVAEDVWMLDDVLFETLDNTGFTFSWTPSASLGSPNSLTPTAAPAMDTWYVIDILQGQCAYEDSIFVEVVDLTVDAGPDALLCVVNGYLMQASSSSSTATYSWNNAGALNNNTILNPIISVDTTLTYWLTVDDGLCIASDSVTVTHLADSNIVSTGDTTICEGDVVTIDLTGNTNISWTPMTGVTNPTGSIFTFSPQTDQLFHVTYNSPVGCTMEDSIQFYVRPMPQVSLINDTVVCIGDPVLITSSINNISNPTYLWSTNEVSSSILTDSAGVYSLTVTTVCGTDTDAMLISNFAPIPLNLGSDTTLCDGDDLPLSITIPQGGNAVWTGGIVGSSYTVSSTSTVWVEISDSNNCSVTDTISVDYHPAAVVDLGSDQDICEYDTIVIDGSNLLADQYSWIPGGQTTPQIDVDSAGVFTLVITDIYGCISSDDIEITEIAAPTPEILGPTEYCITDTVQYSLSQAYNQYDWSTGSTLPTTLVWGNVSSVSVEVIGQNNCVGYDTLDIQMYTVPTIELQPEFHLCDTSLIEITAHLPNATSYTWNNGMSGPTIVVSEGFYAVTAIAVCEATASTEVTVGRVDFTLGSDFHICNDDEVFLAPEINNLDSILWHNDGSNSYAFTYSEDFNFDDTLQIITTAFGCGDVTDTLQLFVDDCNCPFFVPTAFTPNGDEYNNTLRLRHDCLFEEFEFLIFNRWGQIIFQSFDPDFLWDGTYNGTVVQDGTYVWQARYKYAYDIKKTEVYTKVGHVNVLK